MADFDPREGLSSATLVELFGWSEAEFLRRTEGSPIRRIGHERWQRNIAVAMGNALRGAIESSLRMDLLQALATVRDAPDSTDLVKEHATWALAQ